MLATTSRKAIVNEIARRESVQTKSAAIFAIAESVANLCEKHELEACPACGSILDHESPMEYVNGRLEGKTALDSRFHEGTWQPRLASPVFFCLPRLQAGARMGSVWDWYGIGVAGTFKTLVYSNVEATGPTMQAPGLGGRAAVSKTASERVQFSPPPPSPRASTPDVSTNGGVAHRPSTLPLSYISMVVPMG